VPGIRFGLAFCESSGPSLVRAEGTDPALKQLAVGNAQAIGAGHAFLIALQDAYPVNVLNAVKVARGVPRLLRHPTRCRSWWRSRDGASWA
jgi:adenosine/AMP kinase